MNVGTMSPEDFKRIIGNLRSSFDMQIVSLHRDGEPLLNEHLEAYISYQTELGDPRYGVLGLLARHGRTGAEAKTLMNQTAAAVPGMAGLGDGDACVLPQCAWREPRQY